MAEELWKSLVRTLAPGIATAIGGPFAGMGISALSTAILGKPDGTQEELSQAIQSATPEILAKIKLAEMELQKSLKALDIDLEKIAAGDRDSARKREVETKDWFPKVLASIVVCGFLAIVILQQLGHVIDSGTFQVIASAVLLVLGYYFGSSSGSSDKNKLLAASEPAQKINSEFF